MFFGYKIYQEKVFSTLSVFIIAPANPHLHNKSYYVPLAAMISLIILDSLLFCFYVENIYTHETVTFRKKTQ